MRFDVVRTVAAKDLFAIRRNPQVWGPMLIVPVLLGVIVPTLTIAGLARSGLDSEATRLLERLPTVSTYEDPLKRFIDIIANLLLAPLYLIIPLVGASATAADSFAGEKERGTLESLLFTPVDLGSLFLGKLTAAMLAALVPTYAAFGLAVVTVNAAAWTLFGSPFFPRLPWLPVLGLIVPALALAAVLVMVIISARVSTFQAAYQLSGLVVLPVVMLVAGQASGVLVLGTLQATLVGVALVLVDVLLLRRATRWLDRSRLFESQVS